MFSDLVIGMGMVAATTIIHAVFMVVGTRVTAKRWTHGPRFTGHFAKAALISTLTCWMFLAIVLEAWLWALMYLLHPVDSGLLDLETALYFSMVTFTTVGYGDVVLTGTSRLLASIQAANGVIVFGWTTALIFYYIQCIYANHDDSQDS